MRSIKDIYTSTVNGRPAFIKSDLLSTGDKHEGLASERDIDVHRASRKTLAPGFSPKALREYEPRIHSHVDELVNKLISSPATSKGMDMSLLLERASSDLGGSITFGYNALESVKKGNYAPANPSCHGCNKLPKQHWG